jgi:hypothetical protein
LRAGEKEKDMERPRRPYSIQKRPAVKQRHIYYAKFRDESDAYLSAISTGCTRIDDPVRWCEAHLRKAITYSPLGETKGSET